jgi:hypothetical protein
MHTYIAGRGIGDYSVHVFHFEEEETKTSRS